MTTSLTSYQLGGKQCIEQAFDQFYHDCTPSHVYAQVRQIKCIIYDDKVHCLMALLIDQKGSTLM